MDNIVGSPVEGKDFFGREREAARLKEDLANDDVLLLGPRRIGKTSIARAVMSLVREEGWRTVEINVASCVDERGFLDKLDAALKPELASFTDKSKAALGDALAAVGKRIKSVKVPVPGAGSFGVELSDDGEEEEDWTRLASELLRLIAQAEEPWLIYVDELPILLFHIIRYDPKTGVQRVRRFLDWFRNDVRALAGAPRVRWLVSGSIGLDTLAQQHGMAATINSLNHRTLEAFEPEVAVAMLAALAERYGLALGAEDGQALVAAVCWPQPYYLQMAFHHLRELLAARPGATPAELIEQALDQLAQPGSDNDFHHWEQRLSQQLDPADAGHALALLQLAAEDPQGARAEYLLDALHRRMGDPAPEVALRAFCALRDILQRDAYWWPDESSGARRYRFRLEPLRRWWKRRNEL